MSEQRKLISLKWQKVSSTPLRVKYYWNMLYEPELELVLTIIRSK